MKKNSNQNSRNSYVNITQVVNRLPQEKFMNIFHVSFKRFQFFTCAWLHQSSSVYPRGIISLELIMLYKT